eukprot:TRINITY_DN313_c0_g2_i1.p2 TRINITY_DN313_c0_g2~~TRINITY_DN313_c0_g2_i1.p2  ORF type:complete len:104 (+),score=28.19 TRINITY_DN313_c0_g2_i1:165-476(+)
MKKSDERSMLQRALTDLYLTIHFHASKNPATCHHEEDPKHLHSTDPILLTAKIKSAVETLLSAQEERSEFFSMLREEQGNYEEQLKGLEAEARMHIRVYWMRR